MTPEEDFVVEIVYSLKEDLQGKYIEHGCKVGEVKTNMQRLYYQKLSELFLSKMSDKDLLDSSLQLDKEINRRFGSKEFEVVTDKEWKMYDKFSEK